MTNKNIEDSGILNFTIAKMLIKPKEGDIWSFHIGDEWKSWDGDYKLTNHQFKRINN